MFSEPGTAFARHAARTAPQARVHVLAHGETLVVQPR
jgi:hypothetical protein